MRFHMWRELEIVMKLTENRRHAKDPDYGSLLKRLELEKPPEIAYVLVYKARLRERFADVPENFSNTTLPILL